MVRTNLHSIVARTPTSLEIPRLDKVGAKVLTHSSAAYSLTPFGELDHRHRDRPPSTRPLPAAHNPCAPRRAKIPCPTSAQTFSRSSHLRRQCVPKSMSTPPVVLDWSRGLLLAMPRDVTARLEISSSPSDVHSRPGHFALASFFAGVSHIRPSRPLALALPRAFGTQTMRSASPFFGVTVGLCTVAGQIWEACSSAQHLRVGLAAHLPRQRAYRHRRSNRAGARLIPDYVPMALTASTPSAWSCSLPALVRSPLPSCSVKPSTGPCGRGSPSWSAPFWSQPSYGGSAARMTGWLPLRVALFRLQQPLNLGFFAARAPDLFKWAHYSPTGRLTSLGVPPS